MKANKIVYYIATGLLSALMLMSAGMYFGNYDMVSATFAALGYPTYIIYPLAVAKILGVAAIWTRLHPTLVEWAYAGFFFDVVLAMFAHIAVKDGEFAPAAVGMLLVLTSYLFYRRNFVAAT